MNNRRAWRDFGAAMACVLALSPTFAHAAEFDGARLGFIWGLPFAGMLLSIALFPLLAPHFWHRHFGKVAALWALLFAVPFGAIYGSMEAVHQIAHAALLEYLPFVIMLFTLYTVAGGVCVLGNLHGSPGLNTGLLALGAALTNVMGTTGAAMLMVRPLIRANDNRKHNVHIFVFFIFLVANAGGTLTPLGDPPLFLGFLKGVSFFWTVESMLLPTLLLCGALLAIFYLLDRHYYKKGNEERPPAMDATPDTRVRLIGKVNLILIVAVVGVVLMSGLWRPGIKFTLVGSVLELQDLLRDVLLVGIALVSLKITPEFPLAPIRVALATVFARSMTAPPAEFSASAPLSNVARTLAPVSPSATGNRFSPSRRSCAWLINSIARAYQARKATESKLG